MYAVHCGAGACAGQQRQLRCPPAVAGAARCHRLAHVQHDKQHGQLTIRHLNGSLQSMDGLDDMQGEDKYV
ncbi:hypothetical protein DUNSADRAFT_13374 [Dunaliella salina]|uniref:Encoded protein n=1 Tax=Dunaliella salina TaxID=3046 RepID=A0ABQ7G9I2_DUNSA|nr:hypothetical protein DUNSADRAFT_13374 [Dunaliella salina]|eukprot:KAF5831244.1 hypothetical protein DUNSADRAFT_13374 [Dunaliella salina]